MYHSGFFSPFVFDMIAWQHACLGFLADLAQHCREPLMAFTSDQPPLHSIQPYAAGLDLNSAHLAD
jgi:hypothetical protein